MPRPTAIPDLESHLGYWLRFVSNHVSFAFARKLSKKGVTVAEWVMLRMLYEKHPMPSTRLAETMGMTRGAITKLANRLIAKNFVARSAHPNDRRVQLLALTPKGNSFVPTLTALADQNDKEFFGFLSDESRSHIEHCLKDIIKKNALTKIPLE